MSPHWSGCEEPKVTNIIHVLAGNLALGPETLRYPDRAAPANRYRGAITQNAEAFADFLDLLDPFDFWFEIIAP